MAMAYYKTPFNGSPVITIKSSAHIRGRNYFMAICFTDMNIFLSVDFGGGENCSAGK